MVSKLATITTLAVALLGAPVASAFTMGEAVATTGVQNALAGTGSTRAAGTIGTVKRSLGAAAATKQGQLEKAGGQIGWGGTGGGSSAWAPGGGSGWATKGGGSGWASASSGWATGGAAGGGGWASGGWATTMVAAK
jgi:hypothetical protein